MYELLLCEQTIAKVPFFFTNENNIYDFHCTVVLQLFKSYKIILKFISEITTLEIYHKITSTNMILIFFKVSLRLTWFVINLKLNIDE